MTLDEISKGMKTETGSKTGALKHSAVRRLGGRGTRRETEEVSTQTGGEQEKPGMRRYNKDMTVSLDMMR